MNPPPVKLDPVNVENAISMIHRNRDGDMFPPLPEFDALHENPEAFVELVTKKGISEYEPQPSRRFFVPKDEKSFRLATQLHPQDSIILTAILLQFGAQIEARRQPSEKVFAYRFDPEIDHGLYGIESGWDKFWAAASERIDRYDHFLYCDIADFYNQIYHHVVENQLAECGFPNPAIKWIKNLLNSTTGMVSRGIPVGPHGAHLLAETTLIPVDNALADHGIQFIRYADDMLIFCQTEREVHRALYTIARTLDRQQRLTLQHRKTLTLDAAEFREFCQERGGDAPKSPQERRVLEVIEEHTSGNPYVFDIVEIDELLRGDDIFNETALTQVVEEYFMKEPTNYVRLRWLFKRLAQTGHPAALPVVLDRLEKLEPCLSSVCAYVGHITHVEEDRWREIGPKLLERLDDSWLGDNVFSRMSVLSLFSRQSQMVCFPALARRFDISNRHESREILLAAYENDAADWLRERKEDFDAMDAWQRMAYIYCSQLLPKEERRILLPSEKELKREPEFSQWLIGHVK